MGFMPAVALNATADVVLRAIKERLEETGDWDNQYQTGFQVRFWAMPKDPGDVNLSSDWSRNIPPVQPEIVFPATFPSCSKASCKAG